jgi:parallel beta-helix repeat protein
MDKKYRIAITFVIIIAITIIPVVLLVTTNNTIEINSDEDFLNYSFEGDGTVSNPYIIEERFISSEDTYAISITNTSKYFIIRDCYIADNFEYGIYLKDVKNDTASILNNLIFGNGIAGVSLSSCDQVRIENNLFTENAKGINLENSNYCTISNNTISVSEYGINICNGDNNLIVNNTLKENSKNGLLVDCESRLNSIIANEFNNNTLEAINIDDLCNNILIYHNSFIFNNLAGISQAIDNGLHNSWFFNDTSEGNFWNDYDDSGFYQISGSANSTDQYPLANPII